MATMNTEEREAFLTQPRYYVLATVTRAGAPISVPVWFHWDSESVRMFSNVAAPKMKRLEANSSASLLVINHIGESERWVAFDGLISLLDMAASSSQRSSPPDTGICPNPRTKRYWSFRAALLKRSVFLY